MVAELLLLPAPARTPWPLNPSEGLLGREALCVGATGGAAWCLARLPLDTWPFAGTAACGSEIMSSVCTDGLRDPEVSLAWSLVANAFQSRLAAVCSKGLLETKLGRKADWTDVCTSFQSAEVSVSSATALCGLALEASRNRWLADGWMLLVSCVELEPASGVNKSTVPSTVVR